MLGVRLRKEADMARRARKKKARKNKKANHGRRPNS
ncbi:50S ribosomal protein bL37 [Cryptosporangium sp. NPDC048952]